MKVEETVNRWFENAQNRMVQISQSDNNFTTSFCSVAISVMKTYCSAIGFLIDNEFRLPAMALLRVISEFFVKFLWCIKPRNDVEVRNRFHSWENTTAEKKLNLFDGILKSKVGLNEQELTRINQLKDEALKIKNSKRDRMPKITGKGSLFEEVSSFFGTDVSAPLYRQYCATAHIDTSVLSGFLVPTDKGIGIKSDLDENLAMLKDRCLNFAYMFLIVLYKMYGWDIENIKNEYEGTIDSPKDV